MKKYILILFSLVSLRGNADILDELPLPPRLKNNSQMVINCALSSSRKYEIPTTVLLEVSSQEAGKPNMRNINKNKSYDVGYMQFNTSYLRTLKKHGIT